MSQVKKSQPLPKVSIFCSAVRTKDWEVFMQSLLPNKISFEVIFCGDVLPPEGFDKYGDKFKHIYSTVKPAQCCEIARRACRGELIHWTADDCEYPEGLLDDVYDYWKSMNDEKTVFSVQTIENGEVCTPESHRIYDGDKDSPIMAPLGFMSRAFMDKLGGFDRRYVGGQYENDLIMRVYADGGTVYPYKLKSIVIPHKDKHVNFNSNFSKYYSLGRGILGQDWPMSSYTKTTVTAPEWYKFHPYSDENILTVSQDNKGEWN